MFHLLCKTSTYRPTVKCKQFPKWNTSEIKPNAWNKEEVFQRWTCNVSSILSHSNPQSVKLVQTWHLLTVHCSELLQLICICFSQVCLESRALPLVHHVKYICDLPENHRFPMGKFPKVLESLFRDQVITDKQVGHV